MNRGKLLFISLLSAGAAQAHVSQAEGVAHAGEHLWLLLALPALLMLRPLAARLLRTRAKRW